jgi:type III secretory pathway component EscU
MSKLFDSVKEVCQQWSDSIFPIIKTILGLTILTVIVAMIIAGAAEFVSYYGSALFVVTLVVTTFVVSVLTHWRKKNLPEK